MSPPSKLILFAHGSRDPRWQQPFETLTTTLQDSTSKGEVALAYMEMAEPKLMQVATEAYQAGHRTLVILPLFMAAGGHVSRDIPEQVADLKERYSDLEVTVLPPIGEHPAVIEAIREIAREALSSG